LRQISFVWRIFGSLRISGDKKAVTSVKTTWSNRAVATGVGSSLSPRIRLSVLGTSGVIVLAIVVWLALAVLGGDGGESDSTAAFPTPTPFAGPDFMNEIQSLSFALAAARDNGLISQNFNHIARPVTFGEYAEAIGEAERAERGLLAVEADIEVWVIAFAGDVQLELASGEKVAYDNLTVVVDALTDKIYRVEAFYGEFESEARAPVWLRAPTPTPVPTLPAG
jgi:hypothetical protein